MTFTDGGVSVTVRALRETEGWSDILNNRAVLSPNTDQGFILGDGREGLNTLRFTALVGDGTMAGAWADLSDLLGDLGAATEASFVASTGRTFRRTLNGFLAVDVTRWVGRYARVSIIAIPDKSGWVDLTSGDTDTLLAYPFSVDLGTDDTGVTYLVDENGNRIVDESGNFVTV